MVHFETGCYYSTDQLGAEIFGLILAGHPVRTIVEKVATKHGNGMEQPILSFLDELLKETLIVGDGKGVPNSTDFREGAANESPPQSQQGPVPALHKYTDLEDLLLLDPIHDVDESGWPVPRREDPPRTE